MYEFSCLSMVRQVEEIENNVDNDPTSVINRDVSPYILKLKKTFIPDIMKPSKERTFR